MKFSLSSGLPLDLRPRPLCLEFTNTVGDHAGPNPREFLNSYADLVAWAARNGVVAAAEAERLEQEASRHPAAARAALRRALGLREAIYHIFVQHLEGNPPAAADVDIFNAELGGALGAVRLQPVATWLTLTWKPEAGLEALLRPVLASAADLLTRPDLLHRVGQCADAEGCGWLFLDLTKNHSRRWCDMRDCGNRAKARRFSSRQARVE